MLKGKADAEREQIEASMAAIEAQRAVLGDAAVGLALAALREQLARLEAPPPVLEGQRKLVTVLFADVPGITLVSATADAEDLSEAINALWQRVDEIIVAHGGKIDKHTGDAVMALWGAERAQEDDPERALHAALEIQSLAEDEQWQSNAAALSGSDQSLPLLRAGINTGPVMLSLVATTHEFTAIGDTVNVASRLQNAAAAGEILISYDTYRHVRGVFDVVPLDPVQVKGKRDALQVYRLVAAKPRAFRKGMRGVEGIETHLVGRQPEMGRLQGLFRQALVQQRCQMVTITGEAGVGKSRLIHEFDLWTEEQPEWFYLFKGRSSPELQNLPYALLRDMIAFRFRIQEGDSPQEVRHKLESGIAQPDERYRLPLTPPEVKSRAHFLGQLIGFDFKDSPYLRDYLNDAQLLRERALAYLVDYIKALLNDSAVLVLLEDIHWADNASLDALLYISASLAEYPVFIVCAARPELYARRANWAQTVASQRLDLQPLTFDDSLQLVDEILQKVDQVPDGGAPDGGAQRGWQPLLPGRIDQGIDR